jgi:hypothetical protein
VSLLASYLPRLPTTSSKDRTGVRFRQARPPGMDGSSPAVRRALRALALFFEQFHGLIDVD